MAKPLSLSLVVEKLSQYLEQIPVNRRGTAGAMMSAFVHNPEDHAFTAALLTLTLQTPTSKPEAKVNHLQIVRGGGAA